MSQEVSKWADSAMFRAEEMPFKVNEEGPQVTLLNATPNPLAGIAAMAMMYEGKVARDLREVSRETRQHYFEQIKKTHLKAPFEAVSLHFMVEGVTRSFTHQMVRQRTAVFAQESLRFAVKESSFVDETALPPSLMGTLSEDEWVREHENDPGFAGFGPQGWIEQYADDKQKARFAWDRSVQDIQQTYMSLVDSGIPAEDARGLLPHNIATRLNYVTNLRNLQDHGGNRLCTQAQMEWRLVWVRIVESLQNYCSNPEHNTEPAIVHNNECDNWEFQEISRLFMPVCYLTGRCEFKASFDRKCSIRDRVEKFHEHGVKSDEWSNGRVDLGIPAIRPAEWLLDANAAR